MTSSFQSKPTTNGGDWRSNHYSGSSSLSSFSYSPRSNNSSVSSHGKKQTIPAALPRITQDGSLKSNTSQPDKLSSDSHWWSLSDLSAMLWSMQGIHVDKENSYSKSGITFERWNFFCVETPWTTWCPMAKFTKYC